MQERVVILVTHHLDLVGPLASQVITLDQGMISNFEVQEPSEPEPESLEESKTLTPLDARTSSSKLVQDEEMAQGSVSWSVYRRYMRSMGYRFWAALFILMGISRLVSFGQNWVVKTWGEAAEKAPMTFVHYGMDVRMTYFYEALVQQSQAAKNIDGPMRYLLIYVGVGQSFLCEFAQSQV